VASYADAVREELIELSLKRPCCRKSLVAGLLLTATKAEKLVTVSYKQERVALYAREELKRQLGRLPELQPHSAYGHTVWALSVSSAPAARLLEELDRGGLTFDGCDSCRSAFLRGVFLACGTMNDPKRSSNLEFLIPDPSRSSLLSEFLCACGYFPGVTDRKGVRGLYFKNGNAVEDLLAMMGASLAMMDVMNVRIEREIRNQENRATNCVAKNIEKSVSAAAKQMAAIEKLTVTGMLAQLPEAVRATALLRAENPDATLEELRNLHNPPITKSGLNHRLQRILAEADKL